MASSQSIQGEVIMKKYEHDTSYYGGDILRAIRSVTCRNPDLDRGGVYIWSIPLEMSSSTLIIYLNMNDNCGRGSLECHREGKFQSQISYTGILQLNDDCTDCYFNSDRVIDYLNQNISAR